jgi:hypothetical protein
MDKLEKEQLRVPYGMLVIFIVVLTLSFIRVGWKLMDAQNELHKLIIEAEDNPCVSK